MVLRWVDWIAVTATKSLLGLFILAGFIFGFGQPAYCTPASETITDLVSLFINWKADQAPSGFSNQAAKYIDYATMARMALGEEQWKKLSVTQRKTFIAAFRQLIETRYYMRWHKIFKHGKLRYQGEEFSKGDTVVNTTVTVGENTDAIAWRLHSEDGTYKVVDLTVNHTRDLLAILQPRLNRALTRAGFNGLIVWLNRRAATGVSSKPSSADPHSTEPTSSAASL